MRSAKNLQSRPNWNRIQIELKSRSMGANMVTNLLNFGQTLVVRQILKFLNWFEVAAILIFCGTSESLSLILKGLVEPIFMGNTCGSRPSSKLNILYLPYIFFIRKKIIIFCLFAVDTNQKVHRFCNPGELSPYFKMYFERERFNPLMGENLLKEYR